MVLGIVDKLSHITPAEDAAAAQAVAQAAAAAAAPPAAAPARRTTRAAAAAAAAAGPPPAAAAAAAGAGDANHAEAYNAALKPFVVRDSALSACIVLLPPSATSRSRNICVACISCLRCAVTHSACWPGLLGRAAVVTVGAAFVPGNAECLTCLGVPAAGCCVLRARSWTLPTLPASTG